MEAILAIIGLSLAVPGTIVAFAECGEYICRKISSFKDANNLTHELGRFGLLLHHGKLKICLRLAERAYHSPDIDSIMKDGIEDHIDQLRERLRAVEHCLSKFFDEKGEVRKLYFTFLRQKKAERLLQSLREWEEDFTSLMSLIEMEKRIIPPAQQLNAHSFRCRYRSQLGSDSTILLGAAEIMRDGHICELKVLIEQKNLQSQDAVSELQEVARILIDLATRNTFQSGILKCLGFNVNGVGELIFEIPDSDTKPQILMDVIQKDQEHMSLSGRSLDQRLKLARSLCNAVLTVFTSGLVHKSVRTDTILLMSKAGDDMDRNLGSPYLSSWTLVRRADALTSGTAGNTVAADFYRHPKRQGIQPEDRYNMGHDIYSLGVCLIEIGLWAPLLDGDDDNPCPQYLETAIKLKLVSEGSSRQDPKLTAPWMIAKILPQIARDMLPQRMGDRFTDLTIACLTCLEGGMGDVSDFRKAPLVAAVRFNELVVQSFHQI